MSDTPNNDLVICPQCCNQFRAIPVNVQRELAGAHAELCAISDALGTNEGHSSVDHILTLRAEVERLRAALRIIAGFEQCIDNTLGNVEIARRALSGEGGVDEPLVWHKTHSVGVAKEQADADR